MDSIPKPRPAKPSPVVRVLRFIVFLIFTLAAGFGLGWLLAWLDERLGRQTSSSFELGWPHLLLLPVVYLVVITVHELGHVAGGLLVRFRFLLLVVGPLKLVNSQAGLKFEWNTNLAMIGGLAACLPTDTHNLRRRFIALVAGGPLASLVFGLAVSGLAYWLGPRTSLPAFALLITGIMSLAIGGVTLVPGRTAGFMTDGAQILQLLRGGTAVELRNLLIILQALSLSGVRPRQYNPALLEQIEKLRRSLKPDASTAAASLPAYSYHLDRGEIEAAGQALDEAIANLELFPAGVKQNVALEAAYFVAAHRNDAAAACAWLNQSKGGLLIEAHSRGRAEAAVLLAEGKLDQARRAAEQALAAIPKAFDRGGAIGEAEMIQALLDRADPSTSS
jgi:hypothetical protein